MALDPLVFILRYSVFPAPAELSREALKRALFSQERQNEINKRKATR
jgi:hypothetical protein